MDKVIISKGYNSLTGECSSELDTPPVSQIIDGVDVSECSYAITPKRQCPNKPMPYAKETSCISCKEHNTKLNFCKNNPDCYFKQLKRLEQENEQLYNDLKECGIKREQYRQALQEIREIAKEQLQDVSDRCINTTPMYIVHKHIIDKINEVIGAE